MSGLKQTLSVGVPAYNQGRYLKATLDSLLAQTVAPLEIVVSDNHSTDETASILRGYQGRIRAIRPDTHLDMMAHWNFVVANLKGDWVALLSSDDIAKPNYVEVLQRGTERSKSAVLIRAGWETIDAEGRLIEERKLLGVRTVVSPPQTFLEQLLGPKVSFAAFAVRKSAWESVGGFPEQCALVGDWGFWLKISPMGNFVREMPVISQYRADYRPAIQKRRLVPWLQDEFILATEIIPKISGQFNGAFAERVDRGKAQRLFQCLESCSVILEPTERPELVSFFQKWALAIGLGSLENNRKWNRFLTGKRVSQASGMAYIKSRIRPLYAWLRSYV